MLEERKKEVFFGLQQLSFNQQDFAAIKQAVWIDRIARKFCLSSSATRRYSTPQHAMPLFAPVCSFYRSFARFCSLSGYKRLVLRWIEYFRRVRVFVTVFQIPPFWNARGRYRTLGNV